MPSAVDLIKDHEGYRQFVYKCPAGYWTIGYGTNVQEGSGPGISRDVAEKALLDEISHVETALRDQFPWFDSLDPVRQSILVDMGYNLGTNGLFKFKATLKFIGLGQYEAAAQCMKDSAWFNQVGRRSQRLCRMMVTGKWPEDLA